MTTLTIAEIDRLYTVYNATITPSQRMRLLKQAAQAETSAYRLLAAKVAVKVGYGAIQVRGWWYPVVAGIELTDEPKGTRAAAIEIARQHGEAQGIVFDGEYGYITKI